jgi:hypothetical protein
MAEEQKMAGRGPGDGQEQGRSEAGQGLAEYALILAFIALACVAALGALGTAIAGSPGFSIFSGL